MTMKRFINWYWVAFIAVYLLLVSGHETLKASGRARVAVRTYSCGQTYSSHSYAAPYVAPVATYYQPIYQVGYQPDFTALATAALANIEEIKALREDFRAFQQNGLQPQRSQVEHPAVRLMRQDCAVCHDRSVAKSKGSGYVFFDNGVFIESQENLEAVLDAVDKGRMPKNKKWSGDEKYTFLSYHTLKSADAPQAVQAPAPARADLPQAAPAPVYSAPEIERIIERQVQVIIDQRLPPKKAPPPKKPPEKKPPDKKPPDKTPKK
jgi:hypothetical protein